MTLTTLTWWHITISDWTPPTFYHQTSSGYHSHFSPWHILYFTFFTDFSAPLNSLDYLCIFVWCLFHTHRKYVYKQHKHDNYSDRNRHINTTSNDGDQPCQADILHILWSWWNYSLATRCYWCFFIPTKILIIIISRTFKSIKAHHKCFRSLLHKFIIYEEMYSVNYLHRAPALLHSIYYLPAVIKNYAK